MTNNNPFREAFRRKSCWAAVSTALLAAACGGGGAGNGTTAAGTTADQAAASTAGETDMTLASKSWSPSSSGWTYCADEWGTCSFSGTRQVRYGGNGSYAYKTATGSIACTNDVFGDPAYGAVKTCSYSNSTTSTASTSPAPSTTTTAPATSTTTTSPTTTTTSPSTTTPSTTTASWTYCADEWGTCSFSGTRQVRYGANGNYAYKTATGSISCTNDVFGDPAYGAAKTCDYSSSTTSSTTGSTTPTSSTGGTTASTGTTTPTTTTTPSTGTSTPSTSTATPGPYLQDASLYTLAFQDEFNGTSLDTSKWNDHIWYDPSTSTKDYGVGNGSLKIWPQADANGQYKERILTTAGKFEQTYGYFEMEAKLPIGDGCWPAFWLLNSDSPPGEPEIDIMEAYSGDKTGYWADSNQHPIRYGATYYQNGNGQSGLQGTQAPATGDLSTSFHKYGLKWEPGKLTFFFDGKQVYTANVSMTRKMYILLDMQYGSASGSVDGTTPLGSGNSFEVNYVRAWTLN